MRRLRVLREVAMAGSISAAAAALGYTPSAVSQQIAALERETGARLLERHGRGIALTASADTLVEHAHLILAQLERAEADLAAHADRLDGTLRLAAFSTALQTFVPVALARLARDAPHLTVQVTEAEPETALPALTQAHVDLVIGHDYDLLAAPRLPALHRQNLLADPLLVVGLPPSASTAPVTLAELADHRWLLPPSTSSCGQLVRRACEAAGFSPQPTATSQDFAALCALATNGLGVALIPARPRPRQNHSPPRPTAHTTTTPPALRRHPRRRPTTTTHRRRDQRTHDHHEQTARSHPRQTTARRQTGHPRP